MRAADTELDLAARSSGSCLEQSTEPAPSGIPSRGCLSTLTTAADRLVPESQPGIRLPHPPSAARADDCLLVEMLRELPAPSALCYGRMHAATSFLKLAPERNLLRQRMLEGVLGHREDRLLVDELGSAKSREGRLELGCPRAQLLQPAAAQ